MGNQEERAEPANSLAALCMERGDEKKAEALFKEAHGLGCVKGTVNLGTLYFQRGDIEKAKELFEDAREKGDSEAADLLQDRCFLSYRRQPRSEAKCAASDLAGSKTDIQNSIKVGDCVRVGGLSSEAGQRLNGLNGTVRSVDRTSGRFGVEVFGIGPKALKAANLTRMFGDIA